MRRARRRLRPALLLVPASIALAAGAWLWFRDSSLVSVQDVRISGVSGPGAAAIEAALRRARGGMSTLDVNVGALRAAVASYPQVRAIDVSTSFPHAMRITVVEQPAVAVLQAANGARTRGRRRRCAARRRPRDGCAAHDPGRRRFRASTCTTPRVLQYLAVLGAAPASLSRLDRARLRRPEGTHSRDALGHARLLRRRLAPARKVALLRERRSSRATARAPPTSTCDSPNAPRSRRGEAPAPGARRGSGSPGGGAAQGSLATSAALVAGLQAAINGGARRSRQPQSAPASEPQSAAQLGTRKHAARSASEPPSGRANRARGHRRRGAAGHGTVVDRRHERRLKLKSSLMASEANSGALIESSAICNARCDTLQSC